MAYQFYITPEHYSLAEQNGIIPRVVEDRVRNWAWPIEKAISTPVRNRKSLKEWSEVAKENGIPYPALQKRIQVYGWEPERAATEPLMDKRLHMKNVKKRHRNYPLKYVEQAEKNGICYSTFRSRMMRGWGLERASTVKVKHDSNKQFVGFMFTKAGG